MPWSYDETDLTTETSSGRLNVTRLLVGDTDTNDQQLQDEEINFALSENSDNVYSAAGWLARALASKFSRLVNTEIDGALRSEYSTLSQQYTKLAKDLEDKSRKSTGSMGVLAGGITISDIENVRADTNRVKGTFRRDRFRNPPGYNSSDYD